MHAKGRIRSPQCNYRRDIESTRCNVSCRQQRQRAGDRWKQHSSSGGRIGALAAVSVENAGGTKTGTDTDADRREQAGDAAQGSSVHARPGNASLRRAMDAGGKRTLEPTELLQGEIIVHRDVGVAKVEAFEDGISKKTGKKQRYLKLRFADGAARVPFSQARKVLYRYGTDEPESLTLGRLEDRSVWQRKVERARQGVQAQVATLLQIHKERMQAKRQPYPQPDNSLVQQFNNGFPHELTHDQKRAVEEIDADMSAEQPMDRLLVGDVGFGKTEVAARAAFRAVSTGHQVMLLAPTAVLAKQHYESLRTRLEPLGFEVALLSRFQRQRDADSIRRRASNGELKLVIGTHALLSSKVKHKHLRMLIVDEEQRFGVNQKEMIKRFRRSVDVLTLTATPIPRTLQLSLKGIRDASVLQTPPHGRLPIRTWVGEYDSEVVSNAIGYEIRRGGQVLYVVPRIATIDFEERPREIEMMMQRRGVDVSVGKVHGRMNAKDIEEVMERFHSGQLSVLMATAIVENGLDVPAVNTMVVEDAQNFGLAQMYQLRGRVGRREEQAYAVLTYPQGTPLTKEGSNRLRAIEECCELGDGFKIAERDAQIRGGGALFGTEQSGNAYGLGHEMYTEMLVSELDRAERLQFPKISLDSVVINVSGLSPQLPSRSPAGDAGVPLQELQRYEKQILSNAAAGIDALNQVSNDIKSRLGQVPS